MQLKTLATGALLALAALTASAQSAQLGAITIDHASARPTVAGQPMGGGYLRLANAGAADRLVSASAATVCRAVELHVMKMQDDVMRMRQLDAIELPPKSTVEMKPGSYHLMFVGLKAPLQAGQSFPMTLRFEHAGAVDVTVKVGAATAAAPSDSAHRH